MRRRTSWVETRVRVGERFGVPQGLGSSGESPATGAVGGLPRMRSNDGAPRRPQLRESRRLSSYRPSTSGPAPGWVSHYGRGAALALNESLGLLGAQQRRTLWGARPARLRMISGGAAAPGVWSAGHRTADSRVSKGSGSDGILSPRFSDSRGCNASSSQPALGAPSHHSTVYYRRNSCRL